MCQDHGKVPPVSSSNSNPSTSKQTLQYSMCTHKSVNLVIPHLLLSRALICFYQSGRCSWCQSEKKSGRHKETSPEALSSVDFEVSCNDRLRFDLKLLW